MAKQLDPDTIAPPFGAYSHGIDSGPVSRVVVTSGQLGLAPDGSLAPDAAGQARQCLANVTAILQALPLAALSGTKFQHHTACRLGGC